MSLVHEILNEAEQGSDLWNKVRIGKFTSSEIARLIHKKGALTDKNRTYIAEKVAEILTGESREFDNEATLWGKTQEPIAADEFTKQTEIELTECGFVLSETHPEFFGGSPDRLIGEDGLVEIKCPFNSANHIKHCMVKSQEDLKDIAETYYWQIQSNLLVTGRGYAFFISYDPRVTQCPLYTILIKRNEADIQLLEKCLEAGISEVKSILSTLKAA